MFKRIVLLAIFIGPMVFSASAQITVSPSVNIKTMVPFYKYRFEESANITFNPGVFIAYNKWLIAYEHNNINFKTIHMANGLQNGNFYMWELVWKGSLHNISVGRSFLVNNIHVMPRVIYGLSSNARIEGYAYSPDEIAWNVNSKFNYFGIGLDVKIPIYHELSLSIGGDVGFLFDEKEAALNLINSKFGLVYDLSLDRK